TNYADTTLESFLGSPATVPGDSTTRTLLVRNDGPTDATLRATIVNVDLLDADAPDDGNYYDDLKIGCGAGSASMTQPNANGPTRFMEVPLKQGQAVPVSLDYDFPVGAKSGNKSIVLPRLATFDVRLELGGEFPHELTASPGAVTTSA